MFPTLSYYPCILTPSCPCICFYPPSVLLNRLQSKLYNNFHILLLKLAATSLLVLHLLSQPAPFHVVLPVYETDRGSAASAKSSWIEVTVGSCKNKLRINFKWNFHLFFFSVGFRVWRFWSCSIMWVHLAEERSSTTFSFYNRQPKRRHSLRCLLVATEIEMNGDTELMHHLS